MKSIKLDLFKNTTDNRSKIAIKLEDNEQVIQVLQHNSNHDEDILIISTTGGVLRFNKATLREHSGGNTMGRGVVSNGNFIKSCLLVPISGDKLVLLTSDTGKAKVLKLEDISLKKIKQTPNTAFKNNDKNGTLISGLLLDGIEVTELTITASDGKLSLVKFNPQKITPVRRQAQGSIILIDVVDNRIIDVQASAEVQEEALDEEMITAPWDENASNTDLDEEITTNEEPLF
jgi:DNA gyrase/topoisomerase IV subunit A